MITFYQRRATGKSSNLVLQSHSSGLPIAAHSQSHADHLQWLADEVLHTAIPKPFVASPEACEKVGKYLISLLLNCNPNTIEMLGCKPEHYFFITDIGQQMIDNRKLFISRRAVHSFGGYANQQLRRLENALARDKLSQARKEEHILKSMQNAVKAFESRYTSFDNGSMVLYTAESEREDLDREIFADIHIDKYPVREFNSVMNDLTNVIGTYEKLNHRNHKKDDNHLNKHAMHLIRLYLMCLDILENGDIITYREKDHDLLMSIRSGEYQLEDGTYRQEFFDMVNDFEKRLSYAKENTSLPDHPNMKLVEEFVMSVNRRSIGE